MRTVRKKDDKGNFCLAFRQKSADCLILYLSINCYFTKKIKDKFSTSLLLISLSLHVSPSLCKQTIWIVFKDDHEHDVDFSDDDLEVGQEEYLCH